MQKFFRRWGALSLTLTMIVGCLPEALQSLKPAPQQQVQKFTNPPLGHSTEQTETFTNPPLGATHQQDAFTTPPLGVTVLEGRLVLPLGTSSALAHRWWMGRPAFAEEIGVSEEQFRAFQATVDGQPVSLEILETTISKAGNQEAFYRLLNVPEGRNQVVEFLSSSGSIRLSSIVPEVIKGKVVQTEATSVHSTAVVLVAREVARQGGKALKMLTLDDLEALKEQPQVEQTAQALRAAVSHPNNRGKDITQLPEVAASAANAGREIAQKQKNQAQAGNQPNTAAKKPESPVPVSSPQPPVATPTPPVPTPNPATPSATPSGGQGHSDDDNEKKPEATPTPSNDIQVTELTT